MRFESQRVQLLELCLRLSRKGYFAGTGGNAMMRVDDAHVLVTPSAVDYLSMRAADICVLRLADLSQLGDGGTPSVEASLHAGILRRRPDVGCCIHTHQPVASACALIGRALAVPPELHDRLGPTVPVVGYGPSGTSLLAAKVARAIRPQANAYLLRNHGVVCLGRDIADAVDVLDRLEGLSRRHLSALIERRKAEQPQRAAALRRLLDSLNRKLSAEPAA